MANPALFRSQRGIYVPVTNTVNEAGGTAYALPPKHALAQLAATGTLSQTYYATAEHELAAVIKLANEVPPEFLAKTAVFARERGHMKDMPALLCAILSTKSLPLLDKVFPEVIDNGKMLRNFVQIIRSGMVGRKSLGTRPKKLVRCWLESRPEETIFRESVGQSPSMADVIKMVHPKPEDAEKSAFYRYLIGKEVESSKLPPLIQQFESWKKGVAQDVPNVPFQMLTAGELSAAQWAQIAADAKFHTARMNLNTFARHGVFNIEGMDEVIAKKLSDRETIRRTRVFPYQLFTTYKHLSPDVPVACSEAIQDALEIALENIPKLPGETFVFPDVSESMHHPITGERKGSSSKAMRVEVAALMAAALFRRNRNCAVLPFSDQVFLPKLNPRDSVMTATQILASLPLGGTNISLPLVLLNQQQAMVDTVVYISDCESWIDSLGHTNPFGSVDPTMLMKQWSMLKARCPNAKMICIDLQPNTSSQAIERNDILNVGGFSDHVFELMALFVKGELGPDHWVGEIEKVKLE